MRDASSGGPTDKTEDKATNPDEPDRGKILLESWEATTEYNGAPSIKRTSHLVSGPGGSVRVGKDDYPTSKDHAESATARSSGRGQLVQNRVSSADYTSTYLVHSPSMTINDGIVERQPSTRRRIRTDESVNTNRSVAHISEEFVSIPATNVERVLDRPTQLVISQVQHVDFPYSSQQESSSKPVSPRGSARRKFEFGNSSLQRTQQIRRLIPARNNTYSLSEGVARACGSLTEWFKFNADSDLSLEMEGDLKQVSKEWMALVQSDKVKLEEVEDFMAIMYQYSSDLLRSVLQSVDENGSTALHYAVGHSSWSVVNLILSTQYADVNRINNAGYSPIMIAAIGNASSRKDLEIVDQLFSVGNVNQRSKTKPRQTPLILAAGQGATSIVSLLLMNKAAVNLQDASGNTALMCAAHHGHADVVKRLLSRPEIDLYLQDNEGKNAMAIAREFKRQEVVDLLHRKLNPSSTGLEGNVISSSPRSLRRSIRRSRSNFSTFDIKTGSS